MIRIRIVRDVLVGNVNLRAGMVLKAKRYEGTNNCRALGDGHGAILFGDEGIFEVIG